MGIGMPSNKNTKEEVKESDDLLEDDNDSGEHKSFSFGNFKPKTIVLGALAICVVSFIAMSVFNKKPESMPTASSEDLSPAPTIYATQAPQNKETVYDSKGRVTDKDAIDPGLPDLTDDDNNTTSAIVYSADDYIKDLNDVAIPAVYNVDKIIYRNLFVNYVSKRAIIDDGMEMYWVDIVYEGKDYRCQVPFRIFRNLSKDGICVVEAEILQLEGGEKIISYMSVVEKYESLLNTD